MLCFDKLKLLTSTKNLKEFDKKEFDLIIRNDGRQYYKYKKPIPYGLSLITIDFEKDELIIEFTSKISTLSFFNLINEDTIDECLYSIAPLVEFNAFVEDILDEFEVVKCDVTTDVSYENIKKLELYVKSNLSNCNKWICEKWENGFVLKNNVITSKSKKRVVIYDKGKELERMKNKYLPFLKTVYDDGLTYNDFEGIVRIEHNIIGKKAIQKLLNISDAKLTSVLSSDANPILTVLDEALKEIPNNTCRIRSIKEYHCELTLKDCDNDLGKVEAKMRSFYSKNTQIAKIMQPYRELHQRLQNTKEKAFDLRKLLE